MSREKKLLLLFFFMAILLESCSPQKKHDVLTIFFDGVPDPSKKVVKKVDTVLTKQIQVVQEPESQPEVRSYIHPPYKERACSECHKINEGYTLQEKLPALCFNCHDNYGMKFKVLHGPVALGECTICHNPHSSKNEKLLNFDGQSLCYECHEKSDVLKNDVHSGIEDSKCWDCHDPHGGKDRFLVK